MLSFFYEHKSQAAKCVFRLWYSQHLTGWVVNHAQIMRDGEALIPKRAISGEYPDPDAAIANAVRCCEVIAAHLSADKVSTDEIADRLLDMRVRYKH